MLNAEDIISLEKKWFSYKFKSKIKFLFIITLVFLLLFIGIFLYFYVKKVSLESTKHPINTELSQENTLHVNKVEEHNDTKAMATVHQPIVMPKTNEENTTKTFIVDKQKTLDDNLTSESSSIKIAEKQHYKDSNSSSTNEPSYYLKIQPTLKNNDLFSSNGIVHFNPPFVQKEKNIPTKEPIKEKKIVSEKSNNSISISSSEVDTLTYLKDKFSSTGNIVFAIILSEELYNMQKYNESIQWALTANEIDPTNEKSWYWFAKSKVKLKQTDDAIKALETFLSSNHSSRLKTLLKEIKNGD